MNLKHNKARDCPTYTKRLRINKLETMYGKRRFIGYPKEIMVYSLNHFKRSFPNRHMIGGIVPKLSPKEPI